MTRSQFNFAPQSTDVTFQSIGGLKQKHIPTVPDSVSIERGLPSQTSGVPGKFLHGSGNVD